MSKPFLGFIGLGIMGRPMVPTAVARLRGARPLSRQASIDDVCLARCAVGSACGRDVAKNRCSDHDGARAARTLEAVLFGGTGSRKWGSRASTVIDMSTISSLATRRSAARIAELGGAMLDGTVSGGDKAAASWHPLDHGRWRCRGLDWCRPILEVLGSRLRRRGNGRRSGGEVVQRDLGRGHGGRARRGTGAGHEGRRRPREDPRRSSLGYDAAARWQIRGEAILARDSSSPGSKSALEPRTCALVVELAQGIGVPTRCSRLVQEQHKAAQIDRLRRGSYQITS